MKTAQHPLSPNGAFRDDISRVSIVWRRVGLYLTLALGFFLLGFVPMWLKANQAMEQRDAAQREVRLKQLQNTLGNAIVDVELGNFEPARQTMNDFYANLRDILDSDNNTVFTPLQRERLRPLLEERDEVMALLARSDEASATRLSSVYDTYIKLTT